MGRPGYRAPVPLAATHRLNTFSCRSLEQTTWLRDHARPAMVSGTARTTVVTSRDETTVVAYYAWCMSRVSSADAPARHRKGAGGYPQPVALLARLGVDQRHEGHGLGAALLADVVLRLLAVADQIGCRGLLIHCENDRARSFYEHLVPELDPSPTDPLHLVLLVKDARRSLR
jgi:GNAT superfamily N-acetyltransferase